jgi:hypothetical protein
VKHVSSILVVLAARIAAADEIHPPSETVILNDHEHLITPASHGHNAYWAWGLNCANVTYFIDTSHGSMTGAMVNRIHDAINTWDGTDACLTFVELLSDPGNTTDIHIHNGAIDGAGGTLGQASITYDSGHGSESYPDGTPWHLILDVDITMDTGETWFTGAGNPPAGQFDYWSVVLHEIGHALGLGHADSGTEPNSVMLPTISSGTSRRTLTAEDKQVILTLYGAPEADTLALFGVGLATLFGCWRCKRGAA